MFKRINTFGEESLQMIIKSLFWLGDVIILYKAYVFAGTIYLTHTYEKEITFGQGSNTHYSWMDVNNMPLAILSFFLYSGVVILLWKVICELIYIIFNRIKTD